MGGVSDVQLREAVSSAGLERTPILHVSLQDAGQLLSCVSDEPVLRELVRRLFEARWCYRPEEMVAPRNDSDGNLVDVCVWGFRMPKPPPQCPP